MAVSVIAFVAGVAAPALWESTHPPAPPGFDPAIPLPATAAVPALVAGERVTLARFEAIASADTEALLATTAEGSAARAELEPLARAIGSGDVAVEGLVATVTNVEVVSAAGRRATVLVTYELGEYSVWDASGEHQNEALEQTIEVDLVWTEAGWQAERVREASA